jgi:class 3 adenylate cyclase/tetratricopeptide (TPR) repeat protein
VGQASGQPRFTSPGTYTPRHLAEKILTSRSALEGERKLVTVLFADMKGSLEVLADRDPEDVRRILDPVLHIMMDAVHRYEGTVNQVMGDGIMALFGAPLAHEDHAVRACYAALDMQVVIGRHAEAVRRAHGISLAIRVGLNSGEVVVRAIGSDLHMDYTAVGQTTHLAARMEQLASPGGILVTPSTLELVEGYVTVKPIGPVPVKGLADVIEVYEVTGIGPARTRFQAAARRGLTRFVGRDTELEQLRRAQQLAAHGHGQVAAVVGEAGVGKSRLIHEFTHSQSTQGWRVLETASVSYGKATSYLPVIDLLKSYFKIQDRDDLRQIGEKVTSTLLTLDEGLKPALPPLLALLDVPVNDASWQTLDPAQRRQRTLDAVRRLLLREAREQALLLIFEDLHWIDGETQTLLDSLVESLPGARLLLLVDYRPQYQHNWGSKTSYTQLRIDSLPSDTAQELLRELLGSHVTLAPLADLLIARTEGNPFFLEESVRTLVESHVLLGRRGEYRLAQTAQTIHLPATVQAVLAARIDRLASGDKRLLQTAAVIGRDVPLALLQAVADEPQGTLREALARLTAVEFLYEAWLFPGVDYTFTHALTQEAAYEGLLHEQRRFLHARVVEAIQRIYPERQEEHVDRLAHHAIRGENWAMAANYCRQAGNRATSRSANRNGAAYLEQALAALQRLPEHRDMLEQAIDVRLELRGALNALGEMAKVHRYLSEAEALAERLGDQRRNALVAALMTQSLDMIGQHHQAAESAQRALAIAVPLADVGIQIAANYLLSQAYWHLGEFRPATNILGHCLTLLSGDIKQKPFGMVTHPAVAVRAALASRLAELGEFSAGWPHAERALQYAELLDHAYTRVFTWWNVGAHQARRGDVEAAIPLLERAVGLCRTADLPRQVVPSAAILCYAYAHAGQPAKVLALLDQTVAGVEGWGQTSIWWSWLGDAALLAGQPRDAAKIADRALAVSVERQERASQGYALRLLGEIVLRDGSGDVSAAFRHYGEALSLAEELGMRPLIAHCHLGLSRLFRRTGDKAQANAHLTTAMTMYREMEMRFWLEQAKE